MWIVEVAGCRNIGSWAAERLDGGKRALEVYRFETVVVPTLRKSRIVGRPGSWWRKHAPAPVTAVGKRGDARLCRESHEKSLRLGMLYFRYFDL